MVKRVCEQCSGEFNKSPAAIKRGEGRFCSNACRDEWKRVHIEERSGERAPLWRGGVHMENRRINDKLFKLLNPEKTRAHEIVRQAIRSGVLQREPCSRCGTTEGKIQAHHEDYLKPLDVTWFCASCHAKHHLLRRPENTKLRDRSRQNKEREAAKRLSLPGHAEARHC